MTKRRSCCRKIGLLGGTFNPVHNGHLAMAAWAREHAGMDEIWFLPNYIPPHKNATGVSDLADARLAMLRLATADLPDTKILTLELERKGKSYTYETVKKLHEQFPKVRFYFLIGEDSLLDFEHWVKPRHILKFCDLLVARRKDARDSSFEASVRHIRSKYKAAVEVMEMPEIDLSSTKIRNAAASGRPIRGMVPDSVCAYIEAHGLYGGGPHATE